MTAWTDAVDAQIAIVDARFIQLDALRASKVAEQSGADSVYFSQLARAIVMLDNEKAELTAWRAKLVAARVDGHLTDTNTRLYETWNQ